MSEEKKDQNDVTEKSTELTPAGNSPQLFTAAQICEKYGWTIDQFDKRKKKYGFTPVVEARPLSGDGGRSPALYDDAVIQQVIRIRQEEEEEERNRKIAKKLAEPVLKSPGAQQLIFTNYTDTLYDRVHSADKKESLAAAMECAANAAGFMALLLDSVGVLKAQHAELELTVRQQSERIEWLEQELDDNAQEMTVETYAIRLAGYELTRQHACMISKALKAAGKHSDRKVPSKYDPNMESIVWSVKDLNYAANENWFESFVCKNGKEFCGSKLPK